MRRTADITDECRPLADFVHDMHGHLMNRQYGLRRLQCTRVGRDDDPGQRDPGEFHRGGLRLLDAERRQFRILDSWVDAGGGEEQVEVALSVPQQKHESYPMSWS